MKTVLRAATLVVVVLMAEAMKAQVFDPSTGMTVDSSSDLADYSAVMSGQPGNAASEASAQAYELTESISESAQESMDQAMQHTNTSDTPVAVVPSTPKPKMSPNGGRFIGSVQVTLTDADPNAVLHFTTNGKKATLASPVYAGAITVSSKEKVSVLAADPADVASGAVSKTFKPKK